MQFEAIFNHIDSTVFAETGQNLSHLEVVILKGAYDGLTYDEIARDSNYSVNYLQRDIGSKLWRKLSIVLKSSVSKTNFVSVLEHYIESKRLNKPWLSSKQPIFPDKSISLDSDFYIDRPQIEDKCYQEIYKAGALIRIKAPKKMGKTSLLRRIIHHAENLDLKSIYLSLKRFETSVFSNLDTFLRVFCESVSRELRIVVDSQDEYWDEKYASSLANCTTYFQAHVLESLEKPLMIGLDDIDEVFRYPAIATDFLNLLRSWYEESNNLEIWQNLRLAVAHSTECYIPLNVNCSPFNVGLPIKLPTFNLEQVYQLAQCYGLKNSSRINEGSLLRLQTLVGGHPYLIQLALYYLSRGDTSLHELLMLAPTQSGIYRDHLVGYLTVIHEQPQLKNALMKVVQSDAEVTLNPKLAYQLESLGLVTIHGDSIMPSCQLYQQFFYRAFENKNL